MALTRKFLKALAIEDEKIDQIIEAHTDTTDALKADRDKYKDEVDKYKTEADKLPALQKELDELKSNADKDDSFKAKYEAEKDAFDKFKKEVEAEKTKAVKTDAYKALLKKAGVSEKRIDAIVKITKIDDIELDDKGEIKDSKDQIENIKKEYSEFIVKETVETDPTETPPKNTGGKMTKEDIMKIKDRAERQKAISENHELFGY